MGRGWALTRGPTRDALIRQLPFLASGLLVVAMFIAGGVAYPRFASVGVVRALLVDNAFLVMAAVGATVVIISGGIDLSVSGVMALGGVLAAVLIERQGVHPLLAFAIVVASATCFGWAQGWLVGRRGLPPFIVTLAGMFLARGAAFWLSSGSIAVRHPFVGDTLAESMTVTLPIGARGMAIPVAVWIAAAAVGVTWVMLRHTRFGRRVHAVGDNDATAALMGLDVGATRVWVYTCAGVCSGLAAVLFCLYQQSGDPASCKGLELDVIAAVVIGGTLLRGGTGSVLGTCAGVLVLGLIQTIITFQGNLSSWWTRIVAGAIVLGFLLLHRVISGGRRES
jgi:simple sugar transport system permease protein